LPSSAPSSWWNPLADFKDGKATIANLLDSSETVIEIDDIGCSLRLQRFDRARAGGEA
jgi:hypothetical protein